MKLFDSKTRQLLHRVFDMADAYVRSDYHMGYIVDENDYTSNLCSEIRRIVNTHRIAFATTHSQKLPGNFERIFGCDACIILIDHNKNVGKICMFEAKADRKGWDKLDSNGNSHFSDQISRQKRAVKAGFAVWEQFYTKAINGAKVGYRSVSGSTCITYSNANNHNGTHPNSTVWNHKDIDLLSKQQGINLLSLGYIIENVCECKKGSPKSVSEVKAFLKEKLEVTSLLLIQSGTEKEIEEVLDIVGKNDA